MTIPADDAMKKAIDAVYDGMHDRLSARNVVLVALRAIDDAGWQCVPKEADEQMEECGWIDKEDVTPSEIYAAMLDAAPKLVEVKP